MNLFYLDPVSWKCQNLQKTSIRFIVMKVFVDYLAGIIIFLILFKLYILASISLFETFEFCRNASSEI